jgi:hypothetical protein
MATLYLRVSPIILNENTLCRGDFAGWKNCHAAEGRWVIADSGESLP